MTVAHRLAKAMPTARQALLGALLWSLGTGVSSMAGLYLRNGMETDSSWKIALLFAAGGLLAWIPALVTARMTSFGKPAQTRFCACFLFLGLTTLACTALLFAVEYRLHYVQWHAPFPSRIWFFQMVFTTAVASYQFAVLGLRLYFPLGLMFLITASFTMARRMR